MKFPIEVIFVSKKQNFLSSVRIHLSLVLLLITFLIATITVSILYFYNTKEIFDLKNSEQKNETLLKNLDSLNYFLTQMQDDFKNHISEDNRERTFWQMKYIHPDIWSMGIGGKVYKSDKSLSNYTKYLLNEIYESIDVLKGQSYLRKESIEEIEDNIEKNLYLWAHVPSVNPVPEGIICSGFGYRVDPIDNRSIRMHTGVDISSLTGTPISASADGIVSRAEWSKDGYGWVVEIDHGYGFTTRYAHCNKILITEGSTVKRGQIIATVGSSGRSIASHLHYEVEVSGIKVNPVTYINKLNIVVD